MIKNRYLTLDIIEDLAEKMVFIGGPRQVGKTTFAKDIISAHFSKTAYYNWDNRTDRNNIMNSNWPGDGELLLFDEIHKYRKWKTVIKGEFDKLKGKYKFLITGSARMDVYRRGGDSLQGRYHYYRMHPFSLSELLDEKCDVKIFKELTFRDDFFSDELRSLMKFGGFPEPLIKQNDRTLRRWHNEKVERLFREDIRDTGQVRDLGSMKLMSDLLPDKVGSLLSLNSIREDLNVSHRAVSAWLELLEAHYYSFRIYPFTGEKIRSVKKAPKLYLWDWSEVLSEGARFENMIASHLLKWTHYIYDSEGYKADLFYIRSAEKKEVDFLVTIDQKPWFAVEVKMNSKDVSPAIHYFRERLEIPYSYQVVSEEEVDLLKNGVRVISASRFLSAFV